MGGQVTQGLPYPFSSTYPCQPDEATQQVQELRRRTITSYENPKFYSTKRRAVPSFSLMPYAYALYISSRRKVLWSGIRTQSRRLLSS